MKDKNLSKLQEKIGYRFNSIELLRQALTHRSFSAENNQEKDNERLEFLGDAVLELTISHILYEKFPCLSEGELTKMRAGLVNELSLAELSNKITLGKYIRLGKGEEKSGGRKKSSILSDTMEAILGAIYLDGGFKRAFEVIEKLFLNKIEQENFEQKPLKDYKSMLQEFTQANSHVLPIYKVLEAKGPDHDKHFTVGLWLNEKFLATGKGKSKKEAEQQAAKKALEVLIKEENGVKND